jgi:hypothetical protein
MAKNNNPGRILKGTKTPPSLKGASGIWTMDEALQYHRANQWPQPNLFQPVANSLRFKNNVSYVTKQIARQGNQRTFTISLWVKRDSIGTRDALFNSCNSSGNAYWGVEFGADDCLYVYDNFSSNLVTTQVFRDTNAWYHIVVAVDTTQPTSSNRTKVYVNGAQVTSFSSAGYPAQGLATRMNGIDVPNQAIGSWYPSIGAFQYGGYITEVNFIDGYQVDPGLLGKFDTNNTWVPIAYTGSYGTNGFYLPFTNAATSQTLGYDASLTGTPAYGADQDPYRSSVVLHLTGNGPAGGQNNTFADSSTSNLAITRGGSATQGSFSPYPFNTNAPYNPAVHGSSSYFPGTSSDYVQTTIPAALGTGSFTIECWFYNTDTVNQPIFSIGSYSTGIDVRISEAGSNQLGAYFYSVWKYTAFTTVNAWNHLAIVRNSGTTTVYLNGSVWIAGFADSNNYAGTTVRLGGYQAGSTTRTGFLGYICGFRYISGVAVYTAAFTPTMRPFGTLTNNLLPFSEDISNGVWTAQSQNVSFTANAAIAPDGTPSATLIVPSTSSAGTNIAGLHDSPAGVNTFSIYAKSAGYRYIQCLHSRSAGSDAGYVTFDLTTGTVTNSSVWSGSIVNVGNGWYRIIATTSSLSGASSNSNVRWAFTDGSASRGPSFTGNGTSGVYFWGAQAELASSVGNYTPTPANYSTAPALLLNFANAAVVDTAGANDIVTIGSATVTSSSKYGSGALTFNGTTDRLEISGPSAQSSGSAGLYGLTPNLIPGTKDFTVEFWLNTRTGNDTYHRIVSSSNGAFGGGTFCMRHQPGSFLFGPTSAYGVSSYSTDFTLNTWTHVAYSRQGATGRGFINGRQVVTCGDTTNYTEAIQYVGSWYTAGAGEYFNGALDDVRITMGVSRYNLDFTPPARALPEIGGKSFTTTNINAGVVRSFTTVGTTSWTAPIDVTQIEVLVVAGGGAGGRGTGGGGGGGGAGGVIYNNQYPVTPGQTYTVTVGAGAAGITTSVPGSSGSNSVFGNLTAIGGGGGGGNGNGSYHAGLSGGSGGGAGDSSPASSGSAGTPGQGFNGGASALGSPHYGAAGGGGAGAVGQDGTTSTTGNGGAGLQFGISGTPTYYAGGGGGGAGYNNASGNGPVGTGGSGGGGTGGYNGSVALVNATANTGGGGGGVNNIGNTSLASGNGGSGIVIVRYTTNTVGNTSDATTDNLVDSPTLYGHDTGAGGEVVGNYATWNPLLGANMNTSAVVGSSVVVYANGNLSASNPIAAGQAPRMQCHSNIGMTTGKWYAEFTNITTRQVGISKGDYLTYSGTGVDSLISYYNDGTYNTTTGASGTFSGAGGPFTSTDVVGVAVDVDNATVNWYVNGVNRLTITNIASSTRPTLPWYFSSNPSTSGATSSVTANFGQRAWAYTPPAGFSALTTKNLPRLTNAAAIAPNQFFDVSTWTQGASDVTLVNPGGFQPDFVWIKSRNTAQNHYLMDSVRGTTSLLRSNGTGAESTGSTWITFNSNGFTPSSANTVTNTYTYVAWQWKAGGAAVSNTAGTITSQVSANTISGFSIVTYTGTGTAATIGHGLGVAPSMITVKQRNGINNWPTWHTGLTGGNGYYVYWDSQNGVGTSSTVFNGTNPTSSVFSIGTNSLTNGSTSTYVAYCWAEVAGFSKFGSYTGNNNSDGPFVYLGFRPKFIMIKNTTTGNAYTGWQMQDTNRQGYNGNFNITLWANATYPEGKRGDNTVDAAGTLNVDFVSNGFKVRAGGSYETNNTNDVYIYMAFAEAPFGNTNGTAR